MAHDKGIVRPENWIIPAGESPALIKGRRAR